VATIGTIGGISGLAGCSNNQDSSGTTTGTLESEYDFGGDTLNVRTNIGIPGESHLKHVIPVVEDKYNLNIEFSMGLTSPTVSMLESDPKNPPDVVMMDVIGMEKAVHNGWLANMSDNQDLVPNYADIHDAVKFFDGTTAAFVLSEICPFVNTDELGSTPENDWGAIAKSAEKLSLNPFSWTSGVYTLLMAAATATGEPFNSSDLDIDAGFQFLEEHVEPVTENVYGSTADPVQSLINGNMDTAYPAYAYTFTQPVLQHDYIKRMGRPEPAAMPYSEPVAVTKHSEMKEAAFLYCNEAYSPEAQKNIASMFPGAPTNTTVDTPAIVKKVNGPLPEDFESFQWPDFRRIWNERSDWSERWKQIFN